MCDGSPAQPVLHPLVERPPRAARVGGPEGSSFPLHWPRGLIARPSTAHSVPVVSVLEGLPRFAAPRTRPLVEAIALRAKPRRGADLFPTRFRRAFPAKLRLERMDRPTRRLRERRDRSRRPPAQARHRISRPFAQGGRTPSPLGGACPGRSAEKGWRLRPSGGWIQHGAWTTHAIRTTGEPLLAAYVRRAGELAAKSHIDK
jgi:hypothetical protein